MPSSRPVDVETPASRDLLQTGLLLGGGAVIAYLLALRFGPAWIFLLLPVAMTAAWWVRAASLRKPPGDSAAAVDADASAPRGATVAVPVTVLADTFSELPGWQLVCDGQGWIRGSSAGFCRALQFSATTLAGRQLATLFRPEDASLVQERLLPGHVQAPEGSLELTLLDRDGRARPVGVQYLLRADGAGLRTATHLVLFDLSSEREALQALTVKEARYRHLVEEQPDLVSLAKLDGELVFVNRAYAHQFGGTPEQMVGTNLISFVPESERTVVRRHLQRVIETGRSITDQNRMLLPGGGERWVEWINRSLLDEDGRPSLLHSVGRDITERRNVEQAMQRLHQEQLAIINSELIGITRMRHRKFQWVNPGAARMLAYPQDELIGMPAEQAYPDRETFEGLGAAAYPVIHAGRTFRGECRMLRKDGGIIWVEATGVMHNRDFDETLWLLTDVTARKEAEHALQSGRADRPGPAATEA